MKKLLTMLTTGILVVIVVGGFLLFTQLDDIARRMIQKYGSEITGVKVRVSDLNISVKSGEGVLDNLTIGNPDGFTSDYALVMKKINVDANMHSLTKDIVEINSINVDSPEITYELTQAGSNFQIIQNNVNNYKPNGSDKSESDKKVHINNLNITNGKITVSAPTLNQHFVVKLPDIQLNDLGKDPQGGNVEQVMQQIMNSITNSVMEEVGKITMGNFTDFLGKTTNGVLENTGTGIEGVGETIENTFESVFGSENKQ